MKKLPKWLAQIEVLIDRSIPYLLVLLTALIIIDFTHWGEQYHGVIVWADSFIVAFFVADLAFKWRRTRDVLKFVKWYWIDIVAVFPFYAVFRLYREVFVAGEQAQKMLHEAVLLRETKLLREAEMTKLLREGKFVRAFARGLRLLRARWYVAHGKLSGASEALRKR